ncbi:PKD domain-containing protein [Halomarina pelagica]|uniref:PKD domain-containing protein n=1 Tax=Halomarina pelagica TaxID=2961599 RepID=UPI0020C3BE13|nr:PKD domain-containing protein [Halomarina sp. BND7]
MVGLTARRLLILASVLSLSVTPAVGLAPDERPLADAGLDQRVERGATVILDATGSRDPGGHIDRYEWAIRTPSNRSVEPRDPTDPRTTFVASETGRYEVTVTVTDDDGNDASDTLYVYVSEAPSAPPTPPTPRPPSSGPPSATPPSPAPPASDPPTSPPIAAGREPTIDGPTLVTGARPLRGSYELDVDGGWGAIDAVRWIVDGRTVGSGRQRTRAWEPGLHQLRAVVTYVDGSTTTARFPDGTTDVVADPKPTLSLPNLRRMGAISGTADASDGFGNLERVQVTVTRLGTETATMNPSDVRARESDSYSLSFDWSEYDPKRNYTLTATAIDARGQTATVTRTLSPVGTPELVSAEFVNGPVDSYHDRIDPGRYTAHHVVKIALNGADPDRVYVDLRAKASTKVFTVTRKKEVVEDGILEVHSYWAGLEPGDYTVISNFDYYGYDETVRSSDDLSEFSVTPSPPEIRFRTLNDGTSGGYVEPIKIDASGSFDPDGSDLRFGWKLGAKPITPDNTTAVLSFWDNGQLVLKDGQGQTAIQTWSAHAGLVPEILDSETRVRSIPVQWRTTYRDRYEPYAPFTKLRVRVQTEPVHLRRETADISIGAKLDGSAGEIVEWREVPFVAMRGAPGDDPGGENAVYYEGVIEIEAGDLAARGLRPTLVLFNEARPGYVRERYRLPTVSVTHLNETRREELWVSKLSYVIEKPIEARILAESRDEARRLRSYGFTVEDVTTDVSEYQIERRVKVRDAKYETREKLFDQRWQRRLFVDEHPEWSVAGAETLTWREPYTDIEWRRTRGDAFTGDTRRVQESPAIYITERQYEYWTTETAVREVDSRQCLPWIGCYTVTTTRRVSWEEQHTYWSIAPRSYSHDPTGRTRRHLLRPAEYVTEYEHEYTRWRTVSDTRYKAVSRELVHGAKYEWRAYRTVSSDRMAWRLVKNQENFRIGGTVRDRTWILVREGHERVVRPAYEDPMTVRETRATVRGVIVRYHTSDTDPDLTREVIDSFETKFTGDGLLSKEEIKDRIRRNYDSYEP